MGVEARSRILPAAMLAGLAGCGLVLDSTYVGHVAIGTVERGEAYAEY